MSTASSNENIDQHEAVSNQRPYNEDFRASFTIGFNGLDSDLTLISASVMPGESLLIQTLAEARIVQPIDLGTLTRVATNNTGGVLTPAKLGWRWTAPQRPGFHKVIFEYGGETIQLNLFVLTPFRNGEQTRIRGYRIGTYSQVKYSSVDVYSEPRGFIDLSYSGRDIYVSPHFKLGQFLCKQQPGHKPTFLLIRPATLIKLEALLEAANEKGWRAKTLFVMSGFRTPAYNSAIGNKTTHSRHLYGGAADVWIDADHDGQMDDLNGDGQVNKDDARTFAQLAESLATKGGSNWPEGGLGVYGATDKHGPFIHIDARGFPVRWGDDVP